MIALGLRAFEQLGPAEPVDELRREHPLGAVAVNDLGHANEGMPGVVLVKLALVAGFEFVVDLFGQANLDLVDHLGRVESAERLFEDDAEHVGILQVGRDCFVDARVLHLHGDGPFGPGRGIRDDRPVHLADRCSCNGLDVELDEQVGDRSTELGLDGGNSKLGRHRGRVGLELRERQPEWFREPVVEVAGHLTELHQRTLHLAEFVSHLLGGLDLACSVEFVAPCS